jgi:hypothetical protein
MDYAAPQASTNEQHATLPIPWQIWVVVVLLGLEGVSNLFQALDHPVALYWFSAKVLFITGLLKAWKWVFVLFLVVAVQHVIVFLGINVMGSVMNLILVGLTISARRYYFPK